MPDFSHVINLAYVRILERTADPGGLESYNRLMNAGMTEAQMRESLLRSPEYAQNNPNQRVAATRTTGATKKTRKKKKAR